MTSMYRRAFFALAALSATTGVGVLIWAALRRYADIYRLQARIVGSMAIVAAVILVSLGTAMRAGPDEVSWHRLRWTLRVVAITVGALLAGLAVTVVVINVVERLAPTGDAPAPPEAPVGPPRRGGTAPSSPGGPR